MKQNNKGFIAIVLVTTAFLVLVGIGAYWFMTQAKQNKPLSQSKSTQNQQQTNTPGTTASLEAELEIIQFDDPASDLGDIDRDLNSL